VDARAQARIHELYAAAQAEFQSQASPYNPQAVLFMSQVLTFLESSESALVHSRFRLEGRTVKVLGSAFQQLFADGVLTLVHGVPSLS
jgi:hypothetical protein